jgi:hypothetical protein
MSRLIELKKQYPELNLSFFDIMVKMDTSKSYKYLPMLCKIFSNRFDVKEAWKNDEYLPKALVEMRSNFKEKGINCDELSDNQLYFLQNLTDLISPDTFNILSNFIKYLDKGLIDNKDVTSYNGLDSLRSAVNMATIKEFNKELESQVVKEYEDDKWVVVRPLTFSASAKYGANTRWCTTYQKEKNYFEKYWRRGILVYFINKHTGYKFAGFKDITGGDEFSFWNQEDSRVDYLNVEADDYLFSVVKKIFKSEFTNKNLCDNEIQEQVHEECIESYEKGLRVVPNVPDVDRMAQEISDEVEIQIIDRLREAANQYNQSMVQNLSEVQTMRG